VGATRDLRLARSALPADPGAPAGRIGKPEMDWLWVANGHLANLANRSTAITPGQAASKKTTAFDAFA